MNLTGTRPVQRIDQATQVRVGEAYLVPGITRPLWSGALTAWYPVLGLAHADNEYIHASAHFHFDVRFFPADFFPLTKLSYSELVVVAATPQEMMVKVHFTHDDDREAMVVWRNAICQREMPDFPAWTAPWYPALVAGYKNKQVLPGQRCPHQGTCLTGLPQSDEGVVMCPGHGLRWNLKTGRAA